MGLGDGSVNTGQTSYLGFYFFIIMPLFTQVTTPRLVTSNEHRLEHRVFDFLFDFVLIEPQVVFLKTDKEG